MRFIQYSLAGLFVLLLSACSQPTNYTNIDNTQLTELQAKGITVIDIRRSEEWSQTGVVEGSRKLTAFEKNGRVNPKFFAEFTTSIAKDQPVILICRTGNRTSHLSKYLADDLGYTNVYNVRNGITGWIRDGQPVVKN